MPISVVGASRHLTARGGVATHLFPNRQEPPALTRSELPALANYFHNKIRYRRHHEYLAAGFPIASGPVEGACNNLIRDRMEGAGMRRTPAMAEAIVKLRSLYLSGNFDDARLSTSLKTNFDYTPRAAGPWSQNTHPT